MILNYLKISFRNLKKRLPYTLVNVIGLSVGLACFLVLMAYTRYEEHYDDFQENKEQLYRIVFERYQGEELVSVSPATMPALGYRIKDEISGVNGMSRFSSVWGSIVKNERVTSEENNLFYADSDFFNMFSFDLVAGNPNTVLKEPNSVVLTESIALKYFGKEDPLNKELEIANEYGTVKFNVTGIVKDLPLNTSFDFDLLCSFNSIYWGEGWFENHWMWWSFPTYLSISNNVNLETVKGQFPAFIEKYKANPVEADIVWKFDLQPIKDIHLKSDFRTELSKRGSRARTLNLLKIIALLILIISWVNYVNLSTASSTERAKEIGVRKSIGAYKRQISIQFLVEASLVNGIAVLLAIGIIFLAIKPFSNLLGLNYSTEILLQPIFWIYLIPIVVTSIIASGLYPALVLASFKPTEVLNSKTTSSPGSALVRKVLVGVQFTISILLIACTTIMVHQNNYMKQKDLGVNINNVLVVKQPLLVKKEIYESRLTSLINELQAVPEIKYASASFAVPSMSSWGLAVWKNSEDPETQQSHMVNGVDADYINAYDLKLIEGRNFDENRISDKNAVVVSKKSLQILDIEKPIDAIGVKIKMETFGDRLFEIIGIIDDYHHNSLKATIGGLILMPNTGLYSSPKFFSLKLEGSNLSVKKLISEVESVYKRFFPEDLFDFYILKDQFQLQYAEEDRNQNIFTVFSLLAIFLACIGILGLSSFITLLKTRDIAIRKVFGANKSVIFWLLSKEFFIVLIGASAVAIPIIVFFMNDWLEDFPYRISINPWHFVIAVFSILIITLMVVTFNLYKSLIKKPMEILRAI